MPELPRPKVWRFQILVSEHAFDKLVALDVTYAELRNALSGYSEVIEEITVADGVKEVVLLVDWRNPLHVVVVIDRWRREERVVTLYGPDGDLWSRDFRRRR